MLLSSIPSVADADSNDVYYTPTEAQRTELRAAAKYDRMVWGVNRYDYCLGEMLTKDQIRSGAMERLAQETSPAIVRSVLRETSTCAHDSCHGSRWIQHFSSDYPCGGCWGCASPAAKAAWAFSRFVWRMATIEAHTEAVPAIMGFEALARIGLHFAIFAQWFGLFASMPARLAKDFQRIRLGHWYEVVGGRGGAKAHKGKIGRCTWIGVSEEYGTPRLALETTSGDKFFIPAGQVARHLPDDFQESCAAAVDHAKRLREGQKQATQATYDTAEKFDGIKNALALIVAGPLAGKLGIVFWSGTKHGRIRLGVRELGTATDARYARKGEIIREAMWIDAIEARSINQITTAQAEDAIAKMDAYLVTIGTPHADFTRAMVALSTKTRQPIKENRHAHLTGPRAKRSKRAS